MAHRFGAPGAADIFEHISADYVRQPEQAKQLELVRLRLDWLMPPDRVLLEMYLNQNVSTTQLAAATGLAPQTIRRRMKRLSKRLLADEYVRIQRKRDLFSPRQLAFAYDHFLLGLGYRRIAARRRTSCSVVRRILKQLRDWLEDERQRDETVDPQREHQ